MPPKRVSKLTTSEPMRKTRKQVANVKNTTSLYDQVVQLSPMTASHNSTSHPHAAVSHHSASPIATSHPSPSHSPTTVTHHSTSPAAASHHSPTEEVPARSPLTQTSSVASVNSKKCETTKMAEVWDRIYQKDVEYDNDGNPVGTVANELNGFLGPLSRRAEILPVKPHGWRKMDKEMKEKGLIVHPTRRETFSASRENKKGEPMNEAAGRVIAELENLSSQEEDNYGHNDHLSKVLGCEHPGRVRCYNRGVTPTQLWPSSNTSHGSPSCYATQLQDAVARAERAEAVARNTSSQMQVLLQFLGSQLGEDAKTQLEETMRRMSATLIDEPTQKDDGEHDEDMH